MSSEEFQALASRIEREFGPPARKRLNGVRRGGAHARQVRIPTAFLIDLCGLKGWQEGEAKVNENQPLVILNTGGATATEVLRLAKHIRGTIYRRTGIEISVEPELVGFTRDEIADFLNLTG